MKLEGREVSREVGKRMRHGWLMIVPCSSICEEQCYSLARE